MTDDAAMQLGQRASATDHGTRCHPTHALATTIRAYGDACVEQEGFDSKVLLVCIWQLSRHRACSRCPSPPLSVSLFLILSLALHGII